MTERVEYQREETTPPPPTPVRIPVYDPGPVTDRTWAELQDRRQRYRLVASADRTEFTEGAARQRIVVLDRRARQGDFRRMSR